MTVFACFVIVKGIFSEVLNNQVTYNTMFASLSKSERAYFFSYGMTLIALLTDFLYKINGLKVVVHNDEKSATEKGKNKLYDMLLPEFVEMIGDIPE